MLAGCGGTAGRAASPSRPDTPGAEVFPAAQRAAAPDVSGQSLDGTPVRLGDLAGTGVVVINVWASWCTSCRAESSDLAAVAGELSGEPVRFLGIDEQDSAAKARRFVATTGTTYPQVFDPDGVVLGRLSLLPQSGIPSTLVLDADGRMAARIVGPLTRESLRSLIRAVQGDA